MSKIVRRYDGSHPTGGRGIRIAQLREGVCHWPLGAFHEVAKRYCGEPVKKEGCRYCAKHHAQGFVFTPRLVSKRPKS
jgi:hypothetical protein